MTNMRARLPYVTILIPYRAIGWLSVAMIVFWAGLVCAETAPAPVPPAEPFATTGSWVSIDKFQELDETDQGDESAQVEEKAASAPQAEEKPVMAVPDRPINTAVLPSSSSQHAFRVNSTEDERDRFVFDPKSWKSSEQSAKDEAAQKEAQRLMDILGHDPFKVRFAGIPSRDIKSAPAKRISQDIAVRNAAAEKAEKEGAKTEIKPPAKVAVKQTDKQKQIETNQACEAYTEYRRRQLDAIETDRQTLSALQSALNDLGLAQKLGFMTGTQSSLAENPDHPTAAKTTR